MVEVCGGGSLPCGGHEMREKERETERGKEGGKGGGGERDRQTH